MNNEFLNAKDFRSGTSIVFPWVGRLHQKQFRHNEILALCN